MDVGQLKVLLDVLFTNFQLHTELVQTMLPIDEVVHLLVPHGRILRWIR